MEIHMAAVLHKDLMTVREAARVMNIAPRTVSQYRMEGKLPFVQYSSRKYLYPRSGVESFIAKSSHDAQLSLF